MFAAIWTESAAPIATDAEERDLLIRAQAGDEAATFTLIRAYLPALAAAVREFWPMFQDTEELRSVVLVGFLEAVQAWDPGGEYPRVAGIVRQYATDAASREAGQGVMSRIPERTLKRFLGILRRADGDPARGAELAPSLDMASATFTNIYRQFKSANVGAPFMTHYGEESRREEAAETDAVAPWGPTTDPLVGVEDRLLAATALGVLDETEAEVCRLAFGLGGADPLPDGKIAAQLGLSSRLKAQRVRQAAVAKMRAAVGA
ncbi:hypothetical protein [Actinopolymorpha pittospori]|uniref:DNA-directed RNA polymerase specialized sigma subunit n=1 Tax=Actinopolymorpha pittospori TaxID=648752 RepID=A0A927MZL5_9ACTN|nr:hypothetical protein [Actinopolymorpha pittospori]MBE1606222.1 DNA-directed RNA polymerase specialized sigma subunit [Actinopolymorpha pittospori]